ncbi:transposase, partial [Acinetobacter baumannii]
MARKPRIHYHGAFYHAMLRGNAKQNIFFNDEDRAKFCLFLQEAIEQYHCHIHAFCLMDNHIHLAIQVTDIPLSKFMQS